MAKVTRVKYFTKDKVDLINKDNLKIYEKYLRSNIIKNKEVEDTTYKVYKNYMKHFLVYLAEEWDNVDLCSEKLIENAVDIIEGFMAFCQDTLKNNKKVINTKVSAISSFYLWAVKRKEVPYHPFDKRVDRMKGAREEKIINSYFLTEEQIEKIKEGLNLDTKKFDIQDKILFYLAIDSANRIGAISKITLSSMDLDNCVFMDIREKRGKRVEIIFEEDTRDLIEEWLDYRKNNLDGLEVDSLFITKHNKEFRSMTKSTLQRRMIAIGSIIGISDFHAHCTRKTALNLIMEQTGDISLAAEIGNHESIETTRQSYIKPRSKSEVRDKIKELTRRNKQEKSDK